MRGDFSRTTHRPNRHYSRVLLQQGRVLLDADWNEQIAIQLEAMRSMMSDLIGPHGGPSHALAFDIRPMKSESGNKLVLIVANGAVRSEFVEESLNRALLPENRDVGHYYVDGIMVEHDVSALEEGASLIATDIDVANNDAV